MRETFTAYTLDGRVQTKVHDIEKTRLFGGGVELKYIIRGTVGGREVSLIQRPWSYYQDRPYAPVWQSMKDAGLPVVPTVRTTRKKESVLVTDMKADGSEVYGDGFLVSSYERPRPEIDKIFIDVTSPDKFKNIEQKARGYTEIANAHRIILPTECAYSLHIRPNTSWDLIILDLSYAEAGRERINKKFSEAGQNGDPDIFENGANTLSEFIALKNHKSSDEFLKILGDIRKFLLTQKSQE